LGCGTVFQITPEGVLTTLQILVANGSEGIEPGGLIQGTDGILYGTTRLGGSDGCLGGTGCGTVFSMSMGLQPFVKSLPTSAKVGSSVKILGTNLIGATSVSFNGILRRSL
jgi:hypothetical protein